MGHRRWVSAVSLGIASTLSACSSKPLTSDTPAPTLAPPATVQTTIEEACGDLQAAGCAALQRCAPEIFGSAYADVATCVSARSADCIERRLARGSTVTPAQVEACADASRSASCSVVIAIQYGVNPAPDAACVWQGTLPEGEACITSSQCASGSCSFYARDKCGTCVTREDASCLTNDECLQGSRCVAGQCVVASKLGEPCGSLLPCSAELTCLKGSCAALGQAGEPCAAPDTGGCAPNLWCNRQTGNCEHSVLLTGSGDCGVTPAGGNALCPAGSLCLPNADGSARHCAPGGSEGAACSYSIECGVGLACQESVCSKLQADACTPTTTTPNPTYPALLPSVPQAVAPAKATLLAMPKVVLITFDGDSRASALEAYVGALGASAYWRSVTAEYGVDQLVALPPIRVSERPPATLSDAGVRAWLGDKLSTDARFPASDGLTLYVVAYPRGVTIAIPGTSSEAGESCRDFGGYHESFVGPSGSSTPYAVIPDCYYVDPEAAISHETVEAATDPFPNARLSSLVASNGYFTVDAPHTAWSLPAGGGAELADLCEWQPLVSYRDPEVGGLVQRSWSNTAMAAFHQPCVPARAGRAYFNSVPHFDDMVPLQSFAGLVRTRGIAIPLGESKTVPVDLLSDGPVDGPWRVSAYDLKEWTNEFDYTAGVEPTLGFSFDQQSGVNGDTLQLTITVRKQDEDYRAEPFVLLSRRGRDTNLWLGVVGQP